MILLYIVLATIAEMIVALAGIFFVFLGSEKLKRYLPYFISFSVGTFLAVVFLNILPEAMKYSSPDTILSYTLAGFLFFLLLSRFLHWYHHHEKRECSPEDGSSKCVRVDDTRVSIKASGYLVLAGDFIHNFIDGIIIALAFLADVNIGIVTTIAVLFHEFPQEVADFFILINAGFSKKKALLFNFLVSSTTLVGAVITYFLAVNIDKFIGPALGLVAGNFLYIAASDLIPELQARHGAGTGSTIRQFSLILLGVFIMYTIIILMPE
ncbi:MAG: hypothetical protein BMS9Abin13_009 [Patescibacteria group bacterium]|nr:MAG: hypothetical protein BMS9Abin13_009 [Patescibacteria group bacterium]